MQIEINNMIILTIVLFIATAFFAIRKNKILCFTTLALSIVCFLTSFILIDKYITIKNQPLEKTISVSEEGSQTDFDMDIDPTQIEENVKDTVEEVLPNDLYYIDENKKGFGLDFSTPDETGEKVVEAFEEFSEEFN